MSSTKNTKKVTSPSPEVVEGSTEKKVVEDKDKVSAIVNHVMFTESDITSVLTLLSSMSVTGADNILKFSDAYRILSTNGSLIPVTVS